MSQSAHRNLSEKYVRKTGENVGEENEEIAKEHACFSSLLISFFERERGGERATLRL